MAQHNEYRFEKEICEHLEEHGWLYSHDDDGYDRQRALYPEDVFAWLEETQPQELAKKIKQSMSEGEKAKAKDRILTRLAKVLNDGHPSGGSLFVLRNGFQDMPASFDMMQKRPELTGNKTVETKYKANRLRVMRQVHYSTKNQKSLDLVLFVNGIPVATAELKTDFTQSIKDATDQYRKSRQPAGEPLLSFGKRALVHFAVSNDEVQMTTKLEGDSTFFLPFNRGDDGKAGNPPDPSGRTSPTTYLWRDVWQRDQWLDILSKFMHYEVRTVTDSYNGRTERKVSLIFPRYHQLDAVRRMLADAKMQGPGQRYLIQHSAGSGKTKTIAWSAHRLATLHDKNNKKMFDSVIVVTDRNVLDAQLQEAIKQIESTPGFVSTINNQESRSRAYGSKSQYLADELAAGKPIIVVTLQTFPFVMELLGEDDALRGRTFAVIADEAHSSQTGSTSRKLRDILSSSELADLEDGGGLDAEDLISAELEDQGVNPNVSFFAYTATPKGKTLELFGREDADGLPRAFHVYTMQQAIEEGFILDVLQNYTTYQTAFELAKRVEEGKMEPVRVNVDKNGDLVDEDVATKGLMRWVRLHPTNIAQKVQIIVEHFEVNVKHLLKGTAKAMVVTDSRKAAVRYKHAMDAYIKERGLDSTTSLVAFSGEVTFDISEIMEDDPVRPDVSFTESNLNPGVRDLRSEFDTPDYRVMIVANKFQTGFDQPKLCAMYVDKQLSGVAAVQTLSRLNRNVPGKKTVVLDFVNEAEDILEAFKPYYREATMVEKTDPNLIYDLANKLDTSGFYTPEEVDMFAQAFIDDRGNNVLAGLLAPVKRRYVSAYQKATSDEDETRIDELEMFRKDVGTYVRLYDFLSQILNFSDTSVEKRAIFYRHLERQIRMRHLVPDVDLSDIELVRIAHEDTGTHNIRLEFEDSQPLRPITGAGSGRTRDRRMVLMDVIIERLNERFAGEDFRREQLESWVDSLVAALKTDEGLIDQAKANSQEQFLDSPRLRDGVLFAVMDTQEAHSRMTELFNERGDVEEDVKKWLGKLFYYDSNGEGGDSQSYSDRSL